MLLIDKYFSCDNNQYVIHVIYLCRMQDSIKKPVSIDKYFSCDDNQCVIHVMYLCRMQDSIKNPASVFGPLKELIIIFAFLNQYLMDTLSYYLLGQPALIYIKIFLKICKISHFKFLHTFLKHKTNCSAAFPKAYFSIIIKEQHIPSFLNLSQTYQSIEKICHYFQ